jgi:hypothetical protein
MRSSETLFKSVFTILSSLELVTYDRFVGLDIPFRKIIVLEKRLKTNLISFTVIKYY